MWSAKDEFELVKKNTSNKTRSKLKDEDKQESKQWQSKTKA